LTRDRLGDVVETRAVSDVAGDSVETTVIGRGGLLRGSYPGYLDDPLYRRSVYPLRAYDRAYLSPRHESVTKTADAATGETVTETVKADAVTGETEVTETVVSPRGTRSLSPRGHSRIIFDDLLDPRRRGLREDFLIDDLRVKRYNDRLSAGLNSRSLYLDDPQWRRPKTRIDDPILARHYVDGLTPNRYAVSDYPLYDRVGYSALDDPLYRRSALGRRADPLYNDYLARRTAYAVDDPLNRRSAYLMTDPLYRALR
jgi:hypothetical protein